MQKRLEGYPVKIFQSPPVPLNYRMVETFNTDFSGYKTNKYVIKSTFIELGWKPKLEIIIRRLLPYR